MKLIQFIHPMFLMALGLHASLLFVPLGGDSEPALLEEDVPIAELSETLAEGPSGPLPVPDPNVSTGTGKNPAAAKPAPPTAQGIPVGNRQPTANLTAQAGGNAAARAAVRPNAPARGAGSATTLPSPSGGNGGNSGRPTGSGAASGQPAGGQASSGLPNLSSPPSASRLPDLTAPEGESNSAGDASVGSNTQAEVSPSERNLIATASGSVSEGLQALVNRIAQSLTYNEAGTDDPSAARERTAWASELRTQASVEGIERFEPEQIAEVAQLSYPIASSKQVEGQSYRLCLEQPPHTAEVGVLFDSQGNIADEPVVIRSTGYPAIDEEIKATVAAYEDFPANRRSKAYTFEVEVDYDANACINLEELQAQAKEPVKK